MATVYYYYAYMEEGKCVDIERTRTQKSAEDMGDVYIEVTVDEYNAYMNDDTNSVFYIIGKSWNGEEWYLDTAYYYAIINEQFICVNFARVYKEINDKSYVQISKSDYDNLTPYRMRYDADMDSWYEVTFPQYADADTTMISVKGQDVTLQSVIESLQNAIADVNTDIDVDTVMALIKGADGEGSGVDADTLDGHDSSEFITAAQMANYATKTDLSGYATKSDLSSYAAKTDLSNYATNNSLLDVKNSIGNIKTTKYKVGLIIKARGYRGAFSEYVGFRPKAVLVIPKDGNMYEDGIQRGGLYIDDGNDYSRCGCAITDDGFELYAYEEDGIDLLGGNRLYIAFN